MKTNKPASSWRVLFFDFVTKRPFHLRPRSQIMYFVEKPPIYPIYITEMHIVNAHPEQRPFPPDSYFEIQSFNLTSQRWGGWNKIFLFHSPIIIPYANYHDYENGYLIRNHSKEDIYFYLKYCYYYKQELK